MRSDRRFSVARSRLRPHGSLHADLPILCAVAVAGAPLWDKPPHGHPVMGYGSEAIAAIVDQVIGSVHLILYVTDQARQQPSGRVSLTARRLLTCSG